MKENPTPNEIENILAEIGEKLSDEKKLYLQRHFRQQLKYSFVHGIMSGPNGNFDKYYEQKYRTPIKPDDHFGI
jgi:hypothetical protein